MPEVIALGANHPNPFDVQTTIPFEVPVAGHVRIDVLDVAGRIVATLVDEERPAGRHEAGWSAGGRASGVYFVRLRLGGTLRLRRVVLAR